LILADTDVLIDYLTGVQPAENLVKKYIQSDTLQTTAINCFVLLSGAREGKKGDRTRSFVSTVPVLSLDLDSATWAAAVRRKLEDTGRSIGMADSLIAGIALANGLPLLTRNREQFELIDGLSLIPLD